MSDASRAADKQPERKGARPPHPSKAAPTAIAHRSAAAAVAGIYGGNTPMHETYGDPTSCLNNWTIAKAAVGWSESAPSAEPSVKIGPAFGMNRNSSEGSPLGSTNLRA